MIRLRPSTPARPTIEIMVSIRDHDLIVSFIVRLKYSLNNQKPGSLTWENMRLPAPIDNTIKLGETWVMGIIGATIPAVVNPETVADPIQIRIIAAINQAST